MSLGNQHASVKPRALHVAFASRLIVVALGGLEVCLRVRGSTLQGVWRCEYGFTPQTLTAMWSESFVEDRRSNRLQSRWAD